MINSIVKYSPDTPYILYFFENVNVTINNTYVYLPPQLHKSIKIIVFNE